MQVTYTKAELRATLQRLRMQNAAKKLALVPTMGSLHAGHEALLQTAKSYGICVVSIFVNPLQFNEASDYENYPHDMQHDLAICEKHKVELVFAPSAAEMYVDKPLLQLNMPDLCNTLCAQSRPAHFEGVMLVVLRLLHLFQPEYAIFGKKDYQQYLIIRQMVRDLELINLKVIGVETVREASGLAYSSRNALLKGEAYQNATLLYRALKIAAKAYVDGQHEVAELREIIKDVILSGTLNRIDYIELVDMQHLKPLTSPMQTNPTANSFLFALAVFCDNVRLIDNLECPYI